MAPLARILSVFALAAVAAAHPTRLVNMTRVHIVAHSHEDPGWLNTSDSYYTLRVQYIITNVVESLLADERRTFQYVEMWYFRRWWLDQNATMQDSVRRLVREQRLVFLTGGLCMNDEATTHFGAIIDQMTWGHRFLNATFGPEALPTVGWQIDPYGHSLSYTGLTAAMGFDAMVGQKIDFQEWRNRAATKSLEFRWNLRGFGADSNPSVLGHILDDNFGGYHFALPMSPGPDRVLAGATLAPGKALVSPSGKVKLSMQSSDGNLVLRYDGAHVWSSKTDGHPGAYLSMQNSDGNLVLYSADHTSLWSTGSTTVPDSKGMRVILQDDCDLVITDDNGQLLWSLGTRCPTTLASLAGDAWLASAVDAMTATVRKRQGLYLHSDEVLVLFGKDFYFQDAPRPFEDMERVMAYINGRPEEYGMEIFYSSPMRYFEAVRESSWECLPGFDGDIYPCRTTEHYVRSGYFTSRAAEKQSDRIRWAQGHAATLLSAAHGAPNAAALNNGIAAMAAAVGIHQHHDAITGTNRAFVADDYVSTLTVAAEELQPSAAEAAAAAAGLPADGAAACDERNVSVCAATEPLSKSDPITVIVFNPLAANRTEVVEIPVPVATVAARDTMRGEALRCEVHKAFLADVERGHAWSLFVLVEDLAPLESRAITLTAGDGCVLVTTEKLAAGAVASLSTDTGATASVNGTTGGLSALGDVQVTSALEFYEPEMSDAHGTKKDTTTCASAYALRPHGPLLAYPMPAEVVLSRGQLVQQSFSDLQTSGAAQVVRVSVGDSAAQLMHGVGPLDISNDLGQEPVLRVSAPAVASKGIFWTDSNGLEMMRRERHTEDWDNKTLNEPVAQNYYPATAAVALRDADAGLGLSLVIDGARGASSQADGELETMLHRRHVDHGCRVDEGFEMDDSSRIVGSTWLQMGSGAALAAGYRLRGLRALHPPQLYFLRSTPTPRPSSAHPPPLRPLPANVHLLTLQSLEAEVRCDPLALKLCVTEHAARGSLLLRLRHVFAEAEDAKLASDVAVDLAELLSPRWRVVRIDETALTAARVIASDVEPSVNLRPLQIRTFVVAVEEITASVLV